MSVKFRFLLCAVVLMTCVESHGQFMGKIAADNFLYRVAANKRQYYNLPEEEIKGSPYLFSEFINGTIHIDKGTFSGIPFRYNIIDDRVEFKQNDVIYVLDPDVRIKKIIMGSTTLVVEKFEYKWKEQDGYLVLLDTGKVSLMAKKEVSFKARQEPRAMESTPTPARFSPMADVFYYRIGKGKLIKVESVKEMIANFPDKQQELTQFAKKEKISPKKEEELVKLVRYYNSL